MAGIQEYKCPCCGGAIEFNTQAQKMKCPYCDTEFEMEALAGYDSQLREEQEDNMNWGEVAQNEWSEGETDGLSVYVCKSCGGEIVGDKNMGATSCPYCGNPVVLMGQFSGALKPDYVIPFKLDKAAAKRGLENHLKGKKFLPKVFSNQKHINEIKGIYVPYWLFDADAEASIRYRTTNVRTWSDRDHIYTDTSYYSVLRRGTIGFDKIPVDGSSKLDNTLLESIEPYDFKDAVDFQTAYLAGYLADKYDVEQDACIERANSRAKKSTEDTFASSVQGYSTVTPENTCIQLLNGSVKYALYPVWILSTTWQGNNYIFAMNGQTGKFVGDLPCDNSAYWSTFGKYAAILTIIITVIQFVIWLL